MKKLKITLSCIAIVVMIVVVFISFGGLSSPIDKDADYIDLTNKNSNMVYAQVYDMINSPSDYVGKTIKAKGNCGIFTNSNQNRTYYSVIIKDATACCEQGIEFVLNDNNYPSQNQMITVEGIFETYTEGGNTYCRLSSAKLI